MPSAARRRPRSLSEWRLRRATRLAEDRATHWRFDRAVARVQAVDDIVAEHATVYCGRPYRRRVVRPLESAIELPGVTWSVEGETLVEFFPSDDGGPGRLVVHDVALLATLRRALRTRHVRIDHITSNARSRSSAGAGTPARSVR